MIATYPAGMAKRAKRAGTLEKTACKRTLATHRTRNVTALNLWARVSDTPEAHAESVAVIFTALALLALGLWWRKTA